MTKKYTYQSTLTQYIYSEELVEEIERLYKNYSRKEIAKKLDLTTRTINGLFSYRLKSIKLNQPLWTKEEEQILKNNYNTPNFNQLSDILDKSKKSIQRKAERLGIKRRKLWKSQEIEFLKENYGKMYTEQISEKINWSKAAIRRKAIKLGITNIKKSSFEKEVGTFLKNLGLIFDTQVKIGRFTIDFILGNIAIEAYGDYWHCNPKIYKVPRNESQRIFLKRNRKRKKFLLDKEIILFIIWEYDFYNNIKKVKRQLTAVLQSNLQDNHRAKSVELLRNKDNTEVTRKQLVP